MLSGEMDIVLETGTGERRTRLKEGQAFVEHAASWQRPRKPGMLMLITPGAGTDPALVETS